MFGCTGLQSLGIVGTKAEVEDTAWLREVGRLRLLRLQSGVRSLVCDDLFSPSQLEKWAVVSAQPLATTEAEIRDIAAAAGHRVREFVRFGTRRRPAWLLDLAH
ncbi:hypothetical protein [Ideonella sp. A 288]|uniref:hypothetical protein n=1 Tax=Ideonella sp. A 288 TaxID=1962181 RepID=UPI0018FE921A|nr:hypothetical protein [Ideonella sp. A 288]